MTRYFGKRGVIAASVIVASILSTAASAPRFAHLDARFEFASASTAPVSITERDVATSNAKIRMAAGALASMWSADFDRVGARFAVPGFVRYRGAVMSPCGVMRPSNAGYCPGDNNVYFDEVFVATQARSASRELGTDGDMASVGIIAHEVGHAVAIQLGHQSRIVYQNEAIADCLAGAFAERSQQDGSLEAGDIEEAFYGMYSAGDPEPELTGNSRIDNRILRNASLMGHGSRGQRLSNFRHGLDGGPGACLPEFAGLGR